MPDSVPVSIHTNWRIETSARPDASCERQSLAS